MAFTVDFLRFDPLFSCFVWVLRRDSILAHFWHELQTTASEVSDVMYRTQLESVGRTKVEDVDGIFTPDLFRPRTAAGLGIKRWR